MSFYILLIMNTALHSIYKAALPVLLAFSVVHNQAWSISEDHVVKFSGKYASGSFRSLKGSIVFDEKHPDDAKFDVQIEVTSIETGNKLKNKHAQGEKWFNAEKFPLIHFVSKEVKKTNKGYEITGELEIKGVKKRLTIPFSFEEKNNAGVFKGTFKVNRKDFGIGKTKGKASDFTTLDVTVPVTVKK